MAGLAVKSGARGVLLAAGGFQNIRNAINFLFFVTIYKENWFVPKL
jgi:hypothetical protein